MRPCFLGWALGTGWDCCCYTTKPSPTAVQSPPPPEHLASMARLAVEFLRYIVWGTVIQSAFSGGGVWGSLGFHGHCVNLRPDPGYRGFITWQWSHTCSVFLVWELAEASGIEGDHHYSHVIVRSVSDFKMPKEESQKKLGMSLKAWCKVQLSP